MRCEICSYNTADLMLTIITNNKEENIHICKECMKKLYYQTKNNIAAFEMMSNFSNIINSAANKNCSKCGKNYYDYLQEQKFGCAHCYHEFKNELEHVTDNAKKQFKENLPNLINAFKPNDDQDRKQIKALNEIFDINKTENWIQTVLIKKEKLKSAIDNEEYEKAAKLRDELKKLVLNIKNNEGK